MLFCRLGIFRPQNFDDATDRFAYKLSALNRAPFSDRIAHAAGRVQQQHWLLFDSGFEHRTQVVDGRF